MRIFGVPSQNSAFCVCILFGALCPSQRVLYGVFDGKAVKNRNERLCISIYFVETCVDSVYCACACAAHSDVCTFEGKSANRRNEIGFLRTSEI